MMRSVLRIGLLAGGIIAPTLAGQPAGATDLPPAIPTKAPPPPSIWNWTGTYVGLNLGYGSGSWKSGGSIGGQAADPSPNVSGVSAAFRAGHNWQFDRWVLGLEGDFELSGIRGSTNTAIPGMPPVCTTSTIPGTGGDWDWDFDWDHDRHRDKDRDHDKDHDKNGDRDHDRDRDKDRDHYGDRDHDKYGDTDHDRDRDKDRDH